MDALRQLLFSPGNELNTLLMGLRSALIFIIAIALVRLGDRRFLGKNSAFDVVLSVILGSALSRAVNGSANLVGTVAAGLVLIALHWLFAAIAFRSDRFGILIKGEAQQLVQNGQVDWRAMKRSEISEKDLLGSVRLIGRLNTIDQVGEAHLERSGSISVVPVKSEPRVLDVQVEDGVQTVRIKLEKG